MDTNITRRDDSNCDLTQTVNLYLLITGFDAAREVAIITRLGAIIAEELEIESPTEDVFLYAERSCSTGSFMSRTRTDCPVRMLRRQLVGPPLWWWCVATLPASDMGTPRSGG